MRSMALVALALAAAPAASQPSVRTVEVQLSSFAFTPETLRPRAGEPVVLHLVNTGRGGHNFAARQFFAAARITAESAHLISDGAVEVPSRSAVDVRLTPARGSYRLRCTHTLHSAFGMRGRILVE